MDAPILKETIMSRVEIYTFMIEKMIEAGWEDISIDPELHGNIMVSRGQGTNRTHDLIVQMRGWHGATTLTTAQQIAFARTNATDVTIDPIAATIGIRALNSYDDGVMLPATSIIRPHSLMSASGVNLTNGQKCPVAYYVDESTFLFIIQPDPLQVVTDNSLRGNLITFGLPKDKFRTAITNDDMYFASFPMRNTAASGAGLISPINRGFRGTSNVEISTVSVSTSNNFSLDRTLGLEKPYMDIPAWGIIGSYYGFYLGPRGMTVTGDIVEINGMDFRFLNLNAGTNQMNFGTPRISYRVR